MMLLAVLTACALLPVSPAFAAPAVTNPRIEAKKAQAAQAQSKLEGMRTDLEMRVEQYNRIDEALGKTRRNISDTELRLAQADARLTEARDTLQERAEAIYRGGNVNIVEVMIGTTSFEDFLTRIDLLMRIGTNDAMLVADVKAARTEVVDAKSALEQRETEQVSLRRQADAKRQEIEASVADQARFVKSLNSEVTTLIKEEQAREEAAARARAAALAAAQRAAAAAAARSTRHTSGGRAGTNPSGGGHPEAVGVAMKYIGVPYVWGGSSPSGFDCSGLVQYVYHEIGIDIPRTSQDQYYAGTHIAADRLDLLKPGDLLFFGKDANPDQVHHVVMYAGGDDIIEAPYTGSHVKVSSLEERLSHGEYVGASRF